MAIQYINGATVDNPVIVALESEIDRMDAILSERNPKLSTLDLLTLEHKREALMKVYRQFTTPFDTMVVG